MRLILSILAFVWAVPSIAQVSFVANRIVLDGGANGSITLMSPTSGSGSRTFTFPSSGGEILTTGGSSQTVTTPFTFDGGSASDFAVTVTSASSALGPSLDLTSTGTNGRRWRMISAQSSNTGGASAGDFLIYDHTDATLGLRITSAGVLMGNGSGLTNLNAANIATGTVPVNRGGTNITSYSAGDLLYADGTSSLAKLSGNTSTTRRYLSQTGDGASANAPQWTLLSTSDISGLGTIASQAAASVTITGGSINSTTIGATSETSGKFSTLEATTHLKIATGAELRINTSAGTAGQVLTSNGSGTNPTWQNASGGGLATTGGTMTGTITSTHLTPLAFTNASGANISVADGQSLRITDGANTLATISDNGNNGTLTARNLAASGGSVTASMFVSSPTNNPSELILTRAQGTSNSPLIVDDGDRLGMINFKGYDDNSASYRQHAAIRGEADGTVTSSNAPGRIVFLTTNTGSTATERMRLTKLGDLGIGTTTPASNARLAIKDGHFQSQQTTAPTVLAGANGGAGRSASLANATDVAGLLTVTVGAGSTAGSHADVTFNKSYATAPIVVFSPADMEAPSAVQLYYLTSSTSGFSLNATTNVPAGTYEFFYHVIETM